MDVPLAPLGGAVRRFAGVTGGALDRDDALRFDGDASPGAARFAARRIEVDTVSRLIGIVTRAKRSFPLSRAPAQTSLASVSP